MASTLRRISIEHVAVKEADYKQWAADARSVSLRAGTLLNTLFAVVVFTISRRCIAIASRRCNDLFNLIEQMILRIERISYYPLTNMPSTNWSDTETDERVKDSVRNDQGWWTAAPMNIAFWFVRL